MDQSSAPNLDNTLLKTTTQPSSRQAGPKHHSSQEPVPILHTRSVSIQKPPSATLTTRRVSIQEPPQSSLSMRRFSIQNTSPSAISRRLSTHEHFSVIQSRRPSIQDVPSTSYNRWVSSQDFLPGFHPLKVSHKSSHNLSNVMLGTDTQGSLALKPKFLKHQAQSSFEVPTSLTHSPETSLHSYETIEWDSKENMKVPRTVSFQSSQTTIHTLSSFYMSNTTVGNTSEKFQAKHHRQSMLPIGWRLLLEARKFSRELSLMLTLSGMLMISLMCLGQPWIHFQVPLRPSWDPAGPQTIPIDTIFFMQCPDVSCMHEYNKNAYLLDLSWAFLVISSITSFFVSLGLFSTIFFPSTNLPMMDFSLFIFSLTTGTCIILGVLFYLMQAQLFLQEGMTYELGISFYLAWVNVFFFFITGLFSYLNYVNFWSVLALQAAWS